MPVKKKETVFSLNDVGFSYGGSPVLEHVTTDIKAGDYLGIIGPNGGGKTTLLKILLGLLSPTKGSVEFFGEYVASSSRRAEIGYVPQRASSLGEKFPATVHEIVESGRTPRTSFLRPWNKVDKKAVERAYAVTGIAHLKLRRMDELSGGERQRVLIARAIAGEPSVLILDEPTSAVDVESQEQFYDFLDDLRKKLHLTVILVSHDVDIVSHEVDQVLCLNRHLICHGPTDEVMKKLHYVHAHG